MNIFIHKSCLIRFKHLRGFTCNLLAMFNRQRLHWCPGMTHVPQCGSKKSSGAWSQQRDLTKRRKRAQGPEGAGLNLLAIGHWPLRPNKLWDAKWWHMTKASPRIWFLFDPICLFVLSLPMMLGLRVCHSMSRTRKRGKRVSKMVYIMFCPSFLGVQFFYLSGGCF